MDTDGILKATLARTKALPENNKRIIIDVVDKYCAAIGFAENFTGENGPKIRIFTSATEPALPKEEVS